jgi:hypothetical protein
MYTTAKLNDKFIKDFFPTELSIERYERDVPIIGKGGCKLVADKINGEWEAHYTVDGEKASNKLLTDEVVKSLWDALTWRYS